MAGAAMAALQIGFFAGDAAAQASDSAIEEVVVTARKQNETVISVPVAVTALTAEALEERGITDYNSLQDFTPSFKAGKQSTNRNDRGYQVFVMRGMNPGSDLPSRTGTSIFVDGVPIGNGATAGLTDVERLEVVAGPQSAYFGRSTFSGAVNFITRPPGFEFKQGLEFSYARFNTAELKAQVEGPIFRDILAGRISGRYYKTDGQYKNFGYPGKLGAEETKSITGSLYFTPTSSTKIRAHGTTWTDKDGAPAVGQLYAIDYNCRTPTAGAANNYICGAVGAVPANRMTQQTQVPQNVFDVLNRSATVNTDDLFNNIGLHRRAYEFHSSVTQGLPAGYTLDANISVFSSRMTFLTDTAIRDGRSTPNPSFGVVPGAVPYFSRTALGQSYFQDTSGEIRVSSPQEQRLTWLLGVNGYRAREWRVTNAFGNAGFALTVPRGVDGNNTVGVFGAASFKFTDAISLSVEGRRQSDEIQQRTPASNLRFKATFTSFTPRVILSYNPNPNLNVYFSYAEGNRPGTFNSSLFGLPAAAQAQVQAQLAVPVAVDEEKVAMYELGVKGNFFDRRLRILSAFYNGQWTGRQVSQRFTYLNPTVQQATVVIGGSEVQVYGVELEASFRATPELTFEGTYGFAGTKIDKTIDLISLQLLGTQNPVGNRLPRYPVTSGSLSATYEREVRPGLNGFARIDYIYSGKQFDSEANLTWTAPSNRFNVRVGVDRDVYRLELFGLNVFDDDAPMNLTRSTDTYTGGNTIALSPPDRATYGLRVVFRN